QSIREALRTEQFRVYFQPVYHVSNLTLRGAEALIRWEHPEKGIITPAEFIPVAEESGLILQIDRWVLRQACQQLARWHRIGKPDLRVSVNLSMLQFHQLDLVDNIREALEQSGIPPS